MFKSTALHRCHCARAHVPVPVPARRAARRRMAAISTPPVRSLSFRIPNRRTSCISDLCNPGFRIFSTDVDSAIRRAANAAAHAERLRRNFGAPPLTLKIICIRAQIGIQLLLALFNLFACVFVLLAAASAAPPRSPSRHSAATTPRATGLGRAASAMPSPSPFLQPDFSHSHSSFSAEHAYRSPAVALSRPSFPASPFASSSVSSSAPLSVNRRDARSLHLVPIPPSSLSSSASAAAATATPVPSLLRSRHATPYRSANRHRGDNTSVDNESVIHEGSDQRTPQHEHQSYDDSRVQSAAEGQSAQRMRKRVGTDESQMVCFANFLFSLVLFFQKRVVSKTAVLAFVRFIHLATDAARISGRQRRQCCALSKVAARGRV
jgi:hypothetical protein